MTDRKESWSQLLTLLLQTIVPLVVAGGATGVLSTFKENLPQYLYAIFLYVIWGFIIGMLIWLVLRLILGDSPKKLAEWVKDRRQHRTRQKLVEEWHEKWRELCLLLYDVAKKEWKPTKIQEESFSKLRTWFRINRTEFLHMWHNFKYHRRKMAHEYYGSSSSLGHKVFYDNHDDPFSYFYEPLTIKELEHLLQYHHNDMPEVMLKLKELLDECIEWVDKEQ